ncbi:Organic hydroperoxide reductase OsmC/OhrA [Rhizobiales bacterium GAS188]|nr:Organic hydroperoxide reductase OsmC/OhrA [Rhizobiales bacterium GAS188]
MTTAKMKHEYKARIRWTRGDGDFRSGRYSRLHAWDFDEGVSVRASSSPSSVRLPYSAADAVDPEEALVAATSSCHMLFFLSFAQKAGFDIDTYEDEASGVMEEDARGKISITSITLRPKIAFAGERRPNAEELADLHHRSHEHCYIANSIRAEVHVASAE